MSTGKFERTRFVVEYTADVAASRAFSWQSSETLESAKAKLEQQHKEWPNVSKYAKIFRVKVEVEEVSE